MSKKYKITLIAITTFLTIANIGWIFLNQKPPYHDAAGHTIQTYIYTNVLRGVFTFDTITDFFSQSNYYPPFIYWLGSIITAITGLHYKVLQFFSIAFLPTATLLLYTYAKELTKKENWAFYSATLFLLLPHIWEQSRHYMLDLPLTTFILASCLMLTKSKNLTKTKYVALSLVFATMAQLTKWYAGIFLFIPYLIAFTESYNQKKWHQWNKKDWTIITSSLIGCALIALPWYIINFPDLIRDTLFFSHAHFGNPTTKLSLTNFLYYPVLIFNHHIVSIQFIWLIISGIWFVKSTQTIKKFILLQIGFSLLVLTFLGNKNVRFIMPLIPFLALVMGYGLYQISNKSKKLHNYIFTTLVGFSILMFTVNSFSFPVTINTRISITLPPPLNGLWLLDFTSRDVPYHYQNDSNINQTIVTDIAQDIGYSLDQHKVLVVKNDPIISTPTLDIFNFEKNYLNIDYTLIPLDEIQNITNPKDIADYIDPYDYIIVPQNTVSPDYEMNFKNMDAIRSHILGGQTRDYKPIKQYQLPDGDILYLLKEASDYNQISISIRNNQLTLTRPPALAMIFIQYQLQNDQWIQESLSQDQTKYIKDLTYITTIRIDYPPKLWQVRLNQEWQYDGDKQLDRVTEE